MKDEALLVRRLAEVERCLGRGEVKEARKILGDCGSGRDPRVVALAVRIRDLFLRRCQRQGKVEDFLTEAGSDPLLSLAGARLRGPEALRAFASSTHQDRHLAAVAMAADAGDGIKRLWQVPGLRPLAEGWLLLLRRQPERALAQFQAAEGAEPRRARTGQVIALVCLDRIQEARALWDSLGPFPQTAFPAASAVRARLSVSPQEQDPNTLRRLLLDGSEADLRTALRSATSQTKPWLTLRLGDLLWRSGLQDQAIGFWRQVEPRDAWAADALKRRLAAEVHLGERPQSLITLWRVLAAGDPQVARRAVDILSREIPVPLLVQLEDRELLPKGGVLPQASTPVEWQRVWMIVAFHNQMCHTFFDMFDRMVVRNPQRRTPRNYDPLRPMMARLDAAYGEDEVFLRSKLEVLKRYSCHGEQRKTCLRMIRVAPHLADEFLPRWAALALQDRRSAKTVLTELQTLEAAHPGAFDVVRVRVMMDSPGAETSRAALARLPPALAQAVLWNLRHRFPQAWRLDPALIGVHAEADARLILDWNEQEGRMLEALTRSPDACLIACRLAQRLEPGSRCRSFLVGWMILRPGDWRPHLELGLHATALDLLLGEGTRHLSQALLLMPADHPQREVAERALQSRHQNAVEVGEQEDDDALDDLDDALDNDLDDGEDWEDDVVQEVGLTIVNHLADLLGQVHEPIALPTLPSPARGPSIPTRGRHSPPARTELVGLFPDFSCSAKERRQLNSTLVAIDQGRNRSLITVVGRIGQLPKDQRHLLGRFVAHISRPEVKFDDPRLSNHRIIRDLYHLPSGHFA